MFTRFLSWLKRSEDNPADPRIRLGPDDAALVSVRDGKVIAYTLDVTLSHKEFVTRELGELPDGAWVGTIRKLDGAVVAMNSRTYYGNQLPAPPEVFTAVRAAFR